MNKKLWAVVAMTVFFGQGALSASNLFAADDAAKQQELLAAKKIELNGHEWEMKITAAGAKGNATTDVLTFKDMKFESQATARAGFKPTNYTISLQEGGPSIWETMQSDDKGKVIFWRGEWEGESMHGVMSKQFDGKSEDAYFSSVSSKVVADTPKPVESPKVEAVPAEVKDAVEGEAAVKTEEVEAAVKAEAKASEVSAEAKVTDPKVEPKKKKWF